MSKLIKIEFKKNKLDYIINSGLITSIVILGLLCMMHFIGHYEKDVILTDYNTTLILLGMFVNLCAVIFSGILISKFVIDEYKERTINLLSLYPINRKKIILAKLAIVALSTFIFTILSYVVVFSVFYIFQVVTHSTLGIITFQIIQPHLIKLLVCAAANSMIGLIPLYFGLKKKSVLATIVSAFLVGAILNGGNGMNSLSDIIIFPIIFSLIGISAVFFAIKNINREDVNA